MTRTEVTWNPLGRQCPSARGGQSFASHVLQTRPRRPLRHAGRNDDRLAVPGPRSVKREQAPDVSLKVGCQPLRGGLEGDFREQAPKDGPGLINVPAKRTFEGP
jgi:hypothetical protein